MAEAETCTTPAGWLQWETSHDGSSTLLQLKKLYYQTLARTCVMAYAALASLAELLGHIRHQLFYTPRSDELRVLDSLPANISFLQAFLDEYSLNDGEIIQPLEDKIRDAAYQAQDIIELHVSDQIGTSYEVRRLKKSFFRSVFSVSIIRKKRQWRIRNKYYKPALVMAVGQIDLIVKAITDSFPTSGRVEEMQISDDSPVFDSSSRAADSKNEMVGHEEELIMIQEQLCGESLKLKVIPIVGMGEIGKTTFARNIFNDSLVAYHFHTRAWATISQQYRLRGILLNILHSLTQKTDELEQINLSTSPEMNDEQLAEYVYRSLKGKRYLIVMDDMWSVEAWDELRRILPDDSNGSRIVITSRIRNVAEHAASWSSIHDMLFLNDDESWCLLKEKVFVEESCPPKLSRPPTSCCCCCRNPHEDSHDAISLEDYCRKCESSCGSCWWELLRDSQFELQPFA